jgi:hypothetical protein
LYYEGNNQFELKYKIEHENRDRNYLIYSSMPKPDMDKNHLFDTLLYSLEFKADSISMFASELNIDKKYIPLLKEYSFFFQNTTNQDLFKSLEITNYDDYTIPLGMMCNLCDAPICSNQNLIVHIIENDNITENKYIDVFSSNNILEIFWKYCRDFLGWQETSPTLEKMLIAIYLTNFKKDLDMDLPGGLTPFLLRNSGNITQICELLKNHTQKYQGYANYIAEQLNIKSIIAKLPIDFVVRCSVFKEVDFHIIEWITSCFASNDLGASANGKSLVTICDERQKKHLDAAFEHDYRMLKNAALLLSSNIENFPDSLDKFAKDYTEYYYKVDLYYRHFIESYDKLEPNHQYENLQSLIENYYTNSFLSKYISAWNQIYIRDISNLETLSMRKINSTQIKH